MTRAARRKPAFGGLSIRAAGALLAGCCWLAGAATSLAALQFSDGGAVDPRALLALATGGALSAGLWLAFRAVAVRPLDAALAALERDAEMPAAGSAAGSQVARLRRAETAMALALAEARAQTAAQIESAAQADALRAARDAERARVDAARAQVVRQLRDLFHRLAEGDLTVRAGAAFPAEYEALRDDVNSAMVTINASFLVVRRTADAMLGSVAEVADGVGRITARSDTQSRRLSETSTRIGELSSAVRTSAASIAQASESVAFTKAEAESSDVILGQTVEAMEAIVKATSDISQVASVIDSIAFQTNLLAVNASVEAARAGDSGRGFAVVATEVRALAQRTADHAKGISVLIQRSNEQVERGRALVGQTGETLHGIVEQVGEIAEFINEIASATRRQAETLGDVNTVAGSVDSDTRDTADQIRLCLGSATDLRAQADELGDLIEKFRISDALGGRAAGARAA